jgi:hypothetical protein
LQNFGLSLFFSDDHPTSSIALQLFIMPSKGKRKIIEDSEDEGSSDGLEQDDAESPARSKRQAKPSKKKAQIGTLTICALWITLLTFKHFRGRGPCGCTAPARPHAERPEKTSKSNEKR